MEIILVRHGESLSNLDKSVHQSTPDHAIPLTEKGWEQAAEAGKKIRSFLDPHNVYSFIDPNRFIKTYLWQSPYLRTRQTTKQIQDQLRFGCYGSIIDKVKEDVALAERHNVKRIIVVSHGVTIRAIVMRWLHLPFEWFEAEKNPPNCSIRIVKDGTDKGYL